MFDGEDPTTTAPDDFVIAANTDIESATIKVYIDTTRTRGWNEIDAVELIGTDGSRQWASEATASSSFGAGNSLGFVQCGTRLPRADPLANALNQHVKVTMDDTEVHGEVGELGANFILLNDAENKRNVLVNRAKIKFIEWPNNTVTVEK